MQLLSGWCYSLLELLQGTLMLINFCPYEHTLMALLSAGCAHLVTFQTNRSLKLKVQPASSEYIQ